MIDRVSGIDEDKEGDYVEKKNYRVNFLIIQYLFYVLFLLIFFIFVIYFIKNF